MKLLYMDLLTPIGHKNQNKKYINLLSKHFDIYVTCPKGWYNNEVNAKLIEDDAFLIEEGKFKTRYGSIRSMVKNYLLIKKIQPDNIFISSYDTMTLALILPMLKKQCKNKIKILHHMNIDETKNAIKRFIFRTYMRKVDHVVFEDFIMEHLTKSFNIDKNSIFILPHQLNVGKSDCSNNLKYHCVGLSNSNDEVIISELIDNEIKNATIKNCNKIIILKSKYYDFDNGALKVIRGYLDDKIYNEYIINSISIFMPFPISFGYRMSGTLTDALSNNKIAIGTNIKLMSSYSIKYPHICRTINNSKELLREIENIDSDKYFNEFEQFKQNHSDDVIESALTSIFMGLRGVNR